MKVSHDVTKVFISFETNASLNWADSAICKYLLFLWFRGYEPRMSGSDQIVLLANGLFIHVCGIQSNHYLIMSNSFFIEYKIFIPNNRTSKINCSDQYIGLLHFNISTSGKQYTQVQGCSPLSIFTQNVPRRPSWWPLIKPGTRK